MSKHNHNHEGLGGIALLIVFILVIAQCSPADAGPYVEAGLGVPLSPATGYYQDGYGIIGAGYAHHLDNHVSLQLGFEHRSDTGGDTCGVETCYGDNAIEGKVRFEW